MKEEEKDGEITTHEGEIFQAGGEVLHKPFHFKSSR